MPRPYADAGLHEGANDPGLVRALQRDLRALGYLHSVIDGGFGAGTARAVRALQLDLESYDGRPKGAPVAIKDYAAGRAIAVTGRVDPATAACIEDMLADARFEKVPSSPDAAAENRRVRTALAGREEARAPVPFMTAMFKQESNLCHYREPTGRDEDNFVVIGLDRNDRARPDRITSRGYGLGQYTFFHHPLTRAEMEQRVIDPMRNLDEAFDEFRDKFRGFVLGSDAATTADDRVAEHGRIPLRPCKHPESDPRHRKDCRTCAREAGLRDLAAGDPVFPGSGIRWASTAFYGASSYGGVPVRARFECDWPYAARRYNGGGLNSYHYQAIILRNLLTE